MLIRDMFQIYALKHGEPDNLFLILKDYVLDSRLNRDTLNAQILLDIAECYPYYNETTVLKYAIDNFFKTNQYSIKNLADTVFADFNMLYDYEMHTEEDIEDNRDITEARTDAQDTAVNEVENITRDLDTSQVRDLDTRQVRDLDTSNHEEVDSTENSETENTISAYNSSTYQPRDKSTTERIVDTETDSTGTEDETTTNAEDETTTNEEDETVARTKTQVTDFDESENTRTDDDLVRDRDMYEYGLKNGHTYQELIEQQRKIAEFNIYKWIIKRLTKEICLQVW